MSNKHCLGKHRSVIISLEIQLQVTGQKFSVIPQVSCENNGLKNPNGAFELQHFCSYSTTSSLQDLGHRLPC